MNNNYIVNSRFLKEKMPFSSTESSIEAYVLFVNTTEQLVDIFWISFKGLPQFFGAINPGERKRINTFKNHSWIFRSKIGEKMHVNHKEVFWPSPAYYTDINNEISVGRSIVHIHLPIRSLLVASLWSLVKNPTFMENQTIPYTLKEDLDDIREKCIDYCKNKYYITTDRTLS